MRTAIAAKLCLGLLLLALLLPAQISSQNVSTTPSISNTSLSSPTPPVTKQSQNNTTPTGSGNSLHSTASLFIFSLSLLHLYC